LDAGVRGALERAAANIRSYHEHQAAGGYEMEGPAGSVMGQTVRGLERVGLYVPGGRASYPSTVMMNAIPAKIAGVEDLVMVTPPRVGASGFARAEASVPGGTGAPVSVAGAGIGADISVLAAAYIAGVDRVILVGGAQAVAALAFGTESVPRVDKIVGPGNVYVATAKRQLFGVVDIDMVAGPSEILILADDSAEPRFVAADLLSQAEHDPQAAAVLLTTDDRLAKAVAAEIERQLGADPGATEVGTPGAAAGVSLPALCSISSGNAATARASIDTNGLIIICRSVTEMLALANSIAPEHLEIVTRDPFSLLPEIRNSGSVFLGAFTPEPVGDYYAGVNHVLPTSGTARYASPLGVYDFVKRMSYTYYTKEALARAERDIESIGNAEGLTAHVASVKIRGEGK
jgi:histidinol dehydrogenase